jgi:beta-lactamase class D
MDRLAPSLLALFASWSAAATETVAKPEWQKYFDARNARGTFVLFEPANDRYLVFNEARARQRFLPASTFKIPNALIGLEVGSIRDQREVFPWDGKPKPRRAWERDQTLDTGMRDSVVWMFQEIARRTGKARMKEWVAKLEYGNADIGGGVDNFWLQGSMRISAMEQVEFLRKLREGRLPVTQRSSRLARNALVFERTPAYTIYAKTGTTGTVKEPVSWWVGWIEQAGTPTAYFAMNITPLPNTPFGARLPISRAILEDAGALPSGSRPS